MIVKRILLALLILASAISLLFGGFDLFYKLTISSDTTVMEVVPSIAILAAGCLLGILARLLQSDIQQNELKEWLQSIYNK